MAPRKVKEPPKGDIHYTKVRDLMKSRDMKDLKNETLQAVAKELKIALNGKNDERRFRGKMLAAIKNWDK